MTKAELAMIVAIEVVLLARLAEVVYYRWSFRRLVRTERELIED